MSGRTRWRIGGDFCLLLAVLLFLDDENIVLWALFACAIHEWGHVLAIRMLGGRVARFRLSIVGAEIVPERVPLFSYREELYIALLGPLFSFAASILFACIAKSCPILREPCLLLAGLNLAAGLFNLLPIEPLDGARMLRAWLLYRKRIEWVERLCTRISLLFATGLIWLGSFHLLRLGGNLTLLITGAWLLCSAKRAAAV